MTPARSQTRVTLLATLALLAITASWGSTFFLIHDLLDRVPVVDFLAVRFAIASVALLLLSPRAIGRLSPERRRQALVLGGLYGVAQILQTAGLAHTAASVSGFITGMYVVATPLFAALLLRTRIGAMTWLAVLLAVTGLGVLTLGDVSSGLGLGYGEALTLVAALIYALHIVGLGAWSESRDALGMSILQCLVIAAICRDRRGARRDRAARPVGRLARDRLHGADRRGRCPARPDLGAGAPAADPDRDHHEHGAGLRRAVRGAARAASRRRSRMLLGGALVLAAMLIVELVPRRRIEAEVPHIAV